MAHGVYKVVHWLSIAAKMYDLKWPLSEIQGHWFLKCRKIAKYSLVMTQTPCRVARCIISIRPTYSAPRTYLLTQLALSYETSNISKTVKNKAKVTINGLFKFVHRLSIAAKMYDPEWPLSEIQGHWFLKCHTNDEIQLSNHSDAM